MPNEKLDDKEQLKGCASQIAIRETVAQVTKEISNLNITNMQQSHIAWLSKNTNISYETFQDFIRNGFDIHHIDHDRNNNSAENVMLVWRKDHASLHHRIDMQLYAELRMKHENIRKETKRKSKQDYYDAKPRKKRKKS